MHPSPLHERLSAIVGQRSSRYIGEITSTHHETVRRYLTGQSPSVDFLQSLCKAFGVWGEWLLTGKGPMKSADIKLDALRQADAGDLLSALATSVETLISRVDRLEQFMQLMEVRLRGLSPESKTAQPHPPPHLPPQEHQNGQAGRPRQDQVAAPGPTGRARATPLHLAPPPVEQAPAVAVPERVLKLRDAFAGRSPQNAD